MRMGRFNSWRGCTLVLLTFFACDSLRTQHLRQEIIKVGGVSVRAEIAATPADRERGLMYRSSLPQNEGMLFIFPEAKFQAFWMKNTLIPLDIGYFDDQGFLIEVVQMKPDDGTARYPSSEPALYALEMNAGWFEKHGLKKYARLELPRPIQGL